MKLYGELSEWWPIFSTPEEYREEADFFARALIESGDPTPKRVLELGSGGGNSAFHLKRRFAMTLVDLSPHMLAVSRALNPECEHIEGDIRTVRLGRTFDAVFVYDAICHMTTEADLRAVMQTAYEHLATRVAWRCSSPTSCARRLSRTRITAGNDTDRGSVRFLQWTTDPDPATRTTWSTSRFSSETSRARHGWCTTATSTVFSRGPRGAGSCAVSGWT